MDLKDAIWALVYVVTIATVWNTFKNKINNLSENVIMLKKVIYQESGVMNLIDTKTCKEHRAAFKEDVVRVENSSKEALKKLDKLSENVLIIMFALNIDRTKITLPKEKI